MHIRDYSGKKIHFIGIGGISMRGLAQVLHDRGCDVTGSDRDDSTVLDELRLKGIKCYAGHDAAYVHDVDAVVFTSAIPTDNPEYDYCVKHNIPLFERAKLLGQLMDDYSASIGIAGMHGKTTATSMLSVILLKGNIDATIHVGSVLPIIDNTIHVGTEDIFITEACEYMENFLFLNPTIEVILNIEEDHMDYFRDLDHILDTYRQYIANLPENGLVIGNGDDINTYNLASKSGKRTLFFGRKPHNDYRASDIMSIGDGLYTFTLEYEDETIDDVVLSVAGIHHIYNALAAIACAVECGMDIKKAAALVSEYKGAERRFQYIKTYRGYNIYNDYAHHPTEVEAMLKTAKEVSHGKVHCIFQPHTYSRTSALFDKFSRCFDMADTVTLVDIYAAREPDPGNISSRMLAEAVNKSGSMDCKYADSFESAVERIKSVAKRDDTVLILGAGNIVTISDLF